jgi:hypothetical protein
MLEVASMLVGQIFQQELIGKVIYFVKSPLENFVSEQGDDLMEYKFIHTPAAFAKLFTLLRK